MIAKDELLMRGIEVAGRLPKPPGLYKLGYDRAVAEVGRLFMDAIAYVKRYGIVHTALAFKAASRSRSYEPWVKKLCEGLGEAIEALAPMGEEEAAVVIGFCRREYIAQMPFWIFQRHPFSCRWGERVAYRRVWYKLISPEMRGEWLFEIPVGWREDILTLQNDEWIHIIKTTDFSIPLPEGWEEVKEFDEVVIFPRA